MFSTDDQETAYAEKYFGTVDTCIKPMISSSPYLRGS